jgi:hypothetical protein
VIHEVIIQHTVNLLTQRLITDIAEDDPARAGVVKKGELQGDPDPDAARISVTIHENDPDSIIGGGISSISDSWEDEIVETEVGGGATWSRRFTVKARCLFDRTGEALQPAREIAATLRHRIEKTLLGDPYSALVSDGEYVSRGPVSEDFHAEMVQSGGPPDSYDYHIKVRFDVWTSTL